ncbi:heme-binding protein [Sphingosinicella sp. BN140058]|nr:heme-binding protein [Sphingosinicella sp. BN140058]
MVRALRQEPGWAMALPFCDDSGRIRRPDPAPPSLHMQSALRIASAEPAARWNVPTAPGIATAGGGVPVFTAEGRPLGAIGVSGSPTESDIACAEAGVRAAGLRATRP